MTLYNERKWRRLIYDNGAESSQEERHALSSEKYSQSELVYDRERLAELSKLAIGGRSLKEFSKLSGLSEGFLSRLTTGKLKSPPTKRSISKLISEKTNPQNGVTISELMKAAGYPFYVGEKIIENKKNEVPDIVFTAAFAPYLTALALEQSGQLEQDYLSRNQKDIFTISPKSGKEIIGIPAFCKENFSLEDEIKYIQWRLIMALSICKTDLKDKFFLIVTNQRSLYENFDREKIPNFECEFYVALTEDYKKFSRQRPVSTMNINGSGEISHSESAAYDFTKGI